MKKVLLQIRNEMKNKWRGKINAKELNDVKGE